MTTKTKIRPSKGGRTEVIKVTVTPTEKALFLALCQDAKQVDVFLAALQSFANLPYEARQQWLEKLPKTHA